MTKNRETAVVDLVEEPRQTKDEPTGEVLIKAMQDPRVRGLRIKPARFRSRVRDVKL
jgi:hypothetical protein